MKDYKVESLIYYTKLTLDSEHIAKESKREIQEKLDEYAKNGYQLTSIADRKSTSASTGNISWMKVNIWRFTPTRVSFIPSKILSEIREKRHWTSSMEIE